MPVHRERLKFITGDALESTYYEPFVNGLGLKGEENPRVIPRIGVGMRNRIRESLVYPV